MTKEDKEFLNSILETHSARIDGKFDVINNKLDNIEKQTTKTNGRVSKLEENVQVLNIKDQNHIMYCPQQNRIKTLEDEQISSKSIKKFFYAGVGIIVGLGGLILAIIEIVLK